ncbi:hypothetical protein PC118_g20813 [Phytophthora cactorum]|uniref:Uncharacterized protein n=1 Tax=Phytophthora cactorum TaxID=29920 RepID=A0A8T0YEV0_9STRA|nr:hypothetical protein PC113_g20972 [Phytophthora cactorum]KAG2963587.1 hypothetical protein PC118_g20813 [Phytophthora cactorum]
MLEQLTDAARVALNDRNNFGKAEVPFSDEHYEDHLDKAEDYIRTKWCTISLDLGSRFLIRMYMYYKPR